jgi:mitochondrial cardiolipin hydrolase
MTPEEIGTWLGKTLEDQTLSRGERQEFAERVGGLDSVAERQLVMREAFGLARGRLDPSNAEWVLGWLEEVVRTICARPDEPGAGVVEAHFSPGDDCINAILRLLRNSRRSADICVFTITDDRLAEAILDAHRRRVAVRILTDNEKAGDPGSDIDRLHAAGIDVRVDRSPFHMHHKFAVLDGKTLLTGSYNWTRGAARDNQENIIVTDAPRLVKPFRATFDRLWDRLA